MFRSKIMPSVEDKKPLQIPLQEISSATNGFAGENFIAKGGYGHVYKGVSEKHGLIAVKRLDSGQGQGDHEFNTEIALLSEYEHENIVSLIGFCDEDGEKILVYKYESNGSLDKHLTNIKDLTWIQRLDISIDAARGLKYLHDDVGPYQRILHRDVKSSNILLDENRKAKISDFGLSRIGPANMQSTFLISNPCGTSGYIDPEYFVTGYLTQKSDVYSFGVVLFELLCARLAWITSFRDERQFLTVLVRKHYTRKALDKIIPADLYKQIDQASLLSFSNIAYQCLKNGEERPTMKQVVEQLQKARDHQLRSCLHKELMKPQEIVLSVFLHCQGCGRKIRQCLKGFEGVENVLIDYTNNNVVVKGKNMDPLNVLKRVQKKIHREVELLSPTTKPPVEEHKKPKQEESFKQEEKNTNQRHMSNINP